MKKTITAVAILFTSFAAKAQDNFDPFTDRQFIFDAFNICSIVLVIYLITAFFLQLMKQNLDYRLKSKIIEKGTAENIVTQLMQPTAKKPRSNVLQWVFILTGIGVGFTAIKLSRPFGLHSLAIMAFCIAGGFAGYFYFTREKANQ
jgi:hypothetical protein